MEKLFKLKQNGLFFSVSGLENKMQAKLSEGAEPQYVARYVLNSLTDIIFRVTSFALGEYGGSSVVFSGGVSSNSILRERLAPLDAVFGTPEFSTDNAAGIALLASWMAD